MKHLMRYLILTVIISFAMNGTMGYSSNYEERFQPQMCSIDNVNQSLNVQKYKAFSERLGFLESSGRYKIVKGKHKGKYQFSPIALEDINMFSAYDSLEYFPEVQEIALYRWMVKNNDYLEKYIDNFEYSEINGILITRSGILASAHLAGNNRVRKFLLSNGRYDFQDGNGTSISKYMKHFQDPSYQFEFDNSLTAYINYRYDI